MIAIIFFSFHFTCIIRLAWICIKMSQSGRAKGTLPNLSLAETHRKAEAYSLSGLHRQSNTAAKHAILHELHSTMQLRAEKIRLQSKGSSSAPRDTQVAHTSGHAPKKGTDFNVWSIADSSTNPRHSHCITDTGEIHVNASSFFLPKVENVLIIFATLFITHFDT